MTTPPSAPASLRIVFLGSDPIALPLLDWLHTAAAHVDSEPVAAPASAAQLVGVFTQPDRPVGRGQKITPNAIKQWALARGLPVYQPEKLDAAALDTLAGLRPDLSLVMAYGHILRDAFIAAPRLGTLNLHASILPAYRGASPIQTAVASGERETGLSLMRIVRELDAGPVADIERVAIAPLDTALDIEAKLAAATVPLIARNLPVLARGELIFREQDHACASHCHRLQKSDGALDFARPAAALASRINGLFPWPACSFHLGEKPIKCGLADVVAADVADDAPSAPGSPAVGDASGMRDSAASSRGSDAMTPAPGTVLGADADGLLIATGEGILRVRRMQRPGGQMLAAADFLRGNPIPVGTPLASAPMPALVTP